MAVLWNLVDPSRFNPVGQFQQGYQGGQQLQTDRQRKSILADLAGEGGEVDYAQGARRLVGAGDLQGAGTLAQLSQIGVQKQPSSVQEYEYARKQGFGGSMLDYEMAKKRAGATNVSTNVNTAPGFAQAQTEARLKVDTETAKKAGEQALMGARLMPLLDQVEALADKTPGGWAGPVAATTARAMASLGMEVPEGMSNAELLSSISQRLVPIVREPGPTSEREIAMYLRAVPGLMQSAEGRKKVVQMTRAINKRAMEVARVYRTHIGSPDLYDKLSELDKPMFNPRDFQGVAPPQGAPQQGGSPVRVQSPQQRDALPTGTQYIAPDGSLRTKK